MSERQYEVMNIAGGVPVKAWVKGVSFEDTARQQVANAARLPFIRRWIAAMPGVHTGKGATAGSVIPTLGAIIPAAVCVDIGCGMMAVRTGLRADQLPANLGAVRAAIERAVPHGRTPGKRDRGSWQDPPEQVLSAWDALEPEFAASAARTRR